jgi:hypothetical protein
LVLLEQMTLPLKPHHLDTLHCFSS